MTWSETNHVKWKAKIPGLGAYGVTSDHVSLLVEKAAQASSMQANPLPLTRDELAEIITRSL